MSTDRRFVMREWTPVGAAVLLVGLTWILGGRVAALTDEVRTGERTAPAAPAQLERGRYLVAIMHCDGCHTPLMIGPDGPERDMARRLSGHPASLRMPPPPELPEGPWKSVTAGTTTVFAGPRGIAYATNLTPDEMTGIGSWTEEMFITTIRTGRHWGHGRPILPPMPWRGYAEMTDEDLKAVYAYLRTISPIANEVPDAIPSDQADR